MFIQKQFSVLYYHSFKRPLLTFKTYETMSFVDFYVVSQ